MADVPNPAPGNDKLFPSLQTGAAQTAAPKAAAPQADSKNVFTELFGKDASQKEAGLMNNVAQQQEKKSGSFFSPKPKTDLVAKLKGAPMHAAKPGATFLKASILLFVLTVGGFLTQNSSRFSVFGVNPASRMEQATDQVSTLNADLRVQKHLAASLLLDQYSSLADEYFYDVDQSTSSYSSENKRADYKEAAEALRPELLTLLVDIQGFLSETIPDEELSVALSSVDELITQLHAKTGEVDEQSLLQDIQDLETTKILLQSASFKSSVTALNLEGVTDEQLQSLATDFSAINASVNALIGKIKSAREEWSVYLDEVESVTKSVDPLFNTEFPGNLKLDELHLDSDGTLIVSGQTVTDDTKNFTLVSNLIDALEGSEYFMNVEDRSYSKSDSSSEESTYTGSFRINMELQQ